MLCTKQMHRGFLVTTKSFIQHRIESFSFILLYREKNLIQCLFNTIYRFKKSTKYHSIGIYAKKKRETNTQISLLFSPYFMFVRLSLSFSFCSFCGTQKKNRKKQNNQKRNERKPRNIFETIIQQKINLMCKIYDMNEYIKAKRIESQLKSACKQRCHIDSKMNLFFCGQRSVCFMSRHDKHNSNTL